MNATIQARKKFSFAELERQERPNPETFLDTLANYAIFGAAIDARVVIGITDKCQLSRKDLSKVKDWLEVGHLTQIRLRYKGSAHEYNLAIMEVDSRLYP